MADDPDERPAPPALPGHSQARGSDDVVADLRARARAEHEARPTTRERRSRVGRGRGLGGFGARRAAVLACSVVLVAALFALGHGAPDPAAMGDADAESVRAAVSGPRAAADTPPTQSGSPSPPVGSAWRDVLAALDAARSRAFAAGDSGLLADAVAAGSPAEAADAARVAALDASGLRVVGVTRDLVSVIPAEAPQPLDGADVWLRVVDRLSAHQVVDAAGSVVEERPARAEAAWLVALGDGALGWRLVEVRPG